MNINRITDSQLADMEMHIRDIYRDAWEGLHETEAKYFEDFEKRDAKMRESIENGSYPIPEDMTPEQYYKQWRMNQIGRDDRWISLRERMAERMVDADKVAASYIVDETPSIYTLNANYTAYTIEQAIQSQSLGNGATAGVAFDIVDEQTVKRLIAEDVALFPAPKVDVPKDLEWNRDAIQRTLVSSILQGKSIPEIAQAFQHVASMGQNSAIRSARTAVTGAQNAGRCASYEQAQKMGIDLEKQWMCTLDDRTRTSHQMLDGVRVKPGEKFEGHGLQRPIEYPGDTNGAPCDVWNCRCTLIGVIPKLNDNRDTFRRRAAYYVVDPEDDTKRYKTYDVLAGYTYRGEAGTKPYAEWLAEKSSQTQNSDMRRVIDRMMDIVDDGSTWERPVKPTEYLTFDESCDILRNEVGFTKIDTDSLQYVDGALLSENAIQLSELEAKFGIISRYGSTEIAYDDTLTSFAFTRTRKYKHTITGSIKFGMNYDDFDTIVEGKITQIRRKHSMPCATDKIPVYSITHEYGHLIHRFLERQYMSDHPYAGDGPVNRYEYMELVSTAFNHEWEDELIGIMRETNPHAELKNLLLPGGNLSRYSYKSDAEKFAELFANSQLGEPNEAGLAMAELIRRRL